MLLPCFTIELLYIRLVVQFCSSAGNFRFCTLHSICSQQNGFCRYILVLESSSYWMDWSIVWALGVFQWFSYLSLFPKSEQPSTLTHSLTVKAMRWHCYGAKHEKYLLLLSIIHAVIFSCFGQWFLWFLLDDFVGGRVQCRYGDAAIHTAVYQIRFTHQRKMALNKKIIGAQEKKRNREKMRQRNFTHYSIYWMNAQTRCVALERPFYLFAKWWLSIEIEHFNLSKLWIIFEYELLKILSSVEKRAQ